MRHDAVFCLKNDDAVYSIKDVEPRCSIVIRVPPSMGSKRTSISDASSGCHEAARHSSRIRRPCSQRVTRPGWLEPWMMPPVGHLEPGNAPAEEYRKQLAQDLAFATKVLHTSRVPAAVWREWRAYEKAAHERLRGLAAPPAVADESP